MNQQEIEKTFEETYGHKPSPTELATWKKYLYITGHISKEESP